MVAISATIGVVRTTPAPPTDPVVWRSSGNVCARTSILSIFGALFSTTRFWPLGILISAVILLDAIAYNSMVVFVTQRPQVPLRSVIFAVFTFVQFATAYAVFYRSLSGWDHHQFTQELGVISAFYFSVITIATVGYGDISPASSFSQILVVSEIALGVYFLATIVSTIASWANGSPEIPPLERLRNANQ